jgi:hypothetical protein
MAKGKKIKYMREKKGLVELYDSINELENQMQTRRESSKKKELYIIIIII